MNKDAKTCAEFVVNSCRHAYGSHVPSEAAPFLAAATRLLGAKAARKARAKARPAHPAVRRDEGRKAATKREKRAETTELRNKALERAGGRGELCGVLFMWNERPEMAHLDGGSGKRLQDQRLENVVMEHHGCHQGPEGIDTVPLQWLPEVQTHCAKYGYPVPRRFLKLAALRSPETEKETR